MNDQPTPTGNPYSSPKATSSVSPPGVLTHQFKQRNVTQLTTASLVIYCILPTIGLLCWRAFLQHSDGAVGDLPRLAGLQIGPIWLSVVPLILLIVLVASLISHWMNQRGYRWLADQLAVRMAEDGLNCQTFDGQYVQFSPADRPSFYDHHSEWDTGYLFLFRDRMTYVGDQTQFSIRKELLIGEQLGPGGLQWPYPYQVYFDWRDPLTQRIRTFSMWSGIRRSLFFPTVEAEEFRARFSSWRTSRQGAADPEWADLAPPRLDHVEKSTQWEKIGGATLVFAIGGLGFFSWLVAAVVTYVLEFRSDRDLTYAAASITVFALLLQHFPLTYVRNVSQSVSQNSSEPG